MSSNSIESAAAVHPYRASSPLRRVTSCSGSTGSTRYPACRVTSCSGTHHRLHLLHRGLCAADQQTRAMPLLQSPPSAWLASTLVCLVSHSHHSGRNSSGSACSLGFEKLVELDWRPWVLLTLANSISGREADRRLLGALTGLLLGPPTSARVASFRRDLRPIVDVSWSTVPP
jgi:hypothetical protein